MSSPTATEPKPALDSKQRDWLKKIGAILSVDVGPATTSTPDAASGPEGATPSPAKLADDVAKRQQGAVDTALEEWDNLVKEKGTANRGDRIDDYARAAGFNPATDWDDDTPGVQGIKWCGAFVGFAMKQSGFKDAPSLASYQKARDYFLYRSYTGKISNEKLDELRSDQESTGSTRQYFLLEGSESETAALVKKKGKYGSEKYGHFDAAANTFDYQNLPIQPGDVALFKHGHVGMVKSYDAQTGILETVEGNTGGTRADGTIAKKDAVVQKTYDLKDEKDRKKFDGFGRPAAGDFQDAAPAATGGGTSSGGKKTDPTPSGTDKAPTKRIVPGGGGYVYEQHADGRIFIVESPTRGKTRIEVKDKQGYDAILAEIGPFPKPGEVPPSNTGTTSQDASGVVSQIFTALGDAADRVGDAVQDAVDGITERVSGAMDAISEGLAAASGDDSTTGPTPPTASEPKSDPSASTDDAVLKPTTKISASVGKGGKNLPEDVLLVRKLLNKFGYRVAESGEADEKLNTAIGKFQEEYVFLSKPDKCIDPNGKSWNALIGIGRIKGSMDSLAKKYNLEPAVILAIQAIESGGNGYLSDGRPKILFEGHVFWKQLKEVGKKPEDHVSGNEDILYPKWDKSKYVGGAGEYKRLEKAQKIDHLAALKSASWGEFQIMGFNHQSAGYSDVESFVESMKGPGSNQLSSVLSFMDKNNLLQYVRGTNKNWAKFAEGYNGKGYKQNQYDSKLANAYERFSKSSP